MPRRVDDCTTLTCACTALETDVLGQMRAAGGVTSDANLVRIALWSLADHMGLDVPNGAFDLRHYAGGAPPVRVPNPKVRQDRPFKSLGRPQSKSHVWAQREAAFFTAKESV
jgi:hypothetical protein